MTAFSFPGDVGMEEWLAYLRGHNFPTTTHVHRFTIETDPQVKPIVYNATILADTEANDNSFAKKHGPWIATLVAVGGLFVVWLIVRAWRKQKERDRIKLGEGKDGVAEVEMDDREREAEEESRNDALEEHHYQAGSADDENKNRDSMQDIPLD
jgi:hypothetical protein